uniref:Ubiquitin carboxyl-terminal hydrolase n=1 Tax=Kalanchoe fedtschenkoi TaxID=63787 RepID=A0A7N0TAV1_KALFE
MRAPLKTLDHSVDHDRGPSTAPAPDFEVAECGRKGGGGNCGDDDWDMRRSGEREGCDRYEPSGTRFESRWAPWAMIASEASRSRPREKMRLWSPEKKRICSPEKRRIWSPENVFSTWSTDEDNEEDGEKENSESPPRPTPTDVVTAEEPASRVGAGFVNLGNTCFLNAVLQCLVHTSPLLQGLFLVKHHSPCFREKFCLICTLRELVQRSFSSPDEFPPYGIVNNLKYFSANFVRFQQEDAHEFLQCLLDKLEKYPMCSLDPFSVASSDNLVKQVFGGSLISRLRCSECNHISCTPEDLIDFSLEIDNVNTLEGALDSFTKLEKIEDIKLTCDGCDEKVSMEKQFMVDKAPLVASIHLKRFKNDGVSVEKISKLVEYPLSLNLQPYTACHQEHNVDLMYDLYAVIVHMGSTLSTGHYYCFVRSSSNTWHEFDDSTVTGVSESHVLSQEAYILFYAKQGTYGFANADQVQCLSPPIVSTFSPSSVLDNVNQSSESDSPTENPNKPDVRVNRHKDSDSTSQPACLGLQQEDVAKNKGRVKYSDLMLKGEDDDKNEKDTDDYSFHLNLLLADKSRSSFSFDVKPSFGTRQMNSSEENVQATRVQQRNNCLLNNEKCAASLALAEAMINPSSCQTDVNGSPEGVKAEKRILRKRSAEKPIEDPRKKQVLKNLSRTNMPMSRASKLLASITQ